MLFQRIAWAIIVPIALILACEQPPDTPTPGRVDIDDYRAIAQQRLTALERDVEWLYRDTTDVPEERREAYVEAVHNVEQDQEELAETLEEPAPYADGDLGAFRREVDNQLDDIERRINELRLRASASTDAFRERAEEQLSRLEINIQNLRTRAEGLEEDVRAAYEAQLTDQQARLEELEAMLEERLDAEGFGEMQDELATAISELGHTLRNIERDIEQHLYENEELATE